MIERIKEASNDQLVRTVFDPTKPVQTRDGRKARIICTDSKIHFDGEAYPVVALIESRDDQEEIVYEYTEKGESMVGLEDEFDLVNVSEDEVENAAQNLIQAWANSIDHDTAIAAAKVMLEKIPGLENKIRLMERHLAALAENTDERFKMGRDLSQQVCQNLFHINEKLGLNRFLQNSNELSTDCQPDKKVLSTDCQPKENPTLKVGKKYLNGLKHAIQIIKHYTEYAYSFQDNNGSFYNSDGKLWSTIGSFPELNLDLSTEHD